MTYNYAEASNMLELMMEAVKNANRGYTHCEHDDCSEVVVGGGLCDKCGAEDWERDMQRCDGCYDTEDM